jgi:hypothetical protein
MILPTIVSDTVPVAGVTAGTGVAAGGRKFRNAPLVGPQPGIHDRLMALK